MNKTNFFESWSKRLHHNHNYLNIGLQFYLLGLVDENSYNENYPKNGPYGNFIRTAIEKYTRALNR